MAEVFSKFDLVPGDLAPDFSLPDASGKFHSRKESAGPNGMLLVFACNHCPFVTHLAAELGDFSREILKRGVSTVAINSNDIQKYPQDGPEPMLQFAKEMHWNFPYLMDASQEVAKSYGAACTPDFFLFDGRATLFYAGQFDETRPRSGKKPHGADLRDAVNRMLAGESPPRSSLPSSGCNIKWLPATSD
jgi:peroxiredoxin